MARYDQTLRDQNEAPIEGALVSVINSATGAAAVLTNDDTTSLANPFPTDQFGSVLFNTADGFYDLEYHYGGRLYLIDRSVAVGTTALPYGLIADAMGSGTAVAPSQRAVTAAIAAISGTLTKPTRAALAAISSPSNGDVVYLSEAGREGWFEAGPVQAGKVSADTNQGIYVAGSGVTWVRIQDNPSVVRAAWFGISASNSEATNTAIIDTIFPMFLPGNLTIIVPNGVIPGLWRIPYQSGTFQSTVWIKGETAPTTFFGVVAGYTFGSAGSVLSSAATGGTTTTGGIIEVLTSGGNFSSVKLRVSDLRFRTYDNPDYSAVMGYRAQQVEYERCQADTGVWTTSAAQPTHTCRGFVPPVNQNGAWNVMRDLSVSGYPVAYDINEHCVLEGSIAASACLVAFNLQPMNHGFKCGGRLLAQNCKTVVQTHGICRGDMYLDMERADPLPAWIAGGVDIDDANNYWSGRLTYTSTTGNYGPDANITFAGGRFVSAIPITGLSADTFFVEQTNAQSIGNSASYGASPAVVNFGKTATVRYAPGLQTPNITTTNASGVIAFSSNAGISPGMYIISANVPDSTTVTDLTHMLNNATSSATVAAYVFSPVAVRMTGTTFPIIKECRFKVKAAVTFAANATGYRKLAIVETGGALKEVVVNAASAGPTTVLVEWTGTFTTNTGVIHLEVEQNSGGALDITNTTFLFEEL